MPTSFMDGPIAIGKDRENGGAIWRPPSIVSSTALAAHLAQRLKSHEISKSSPSFRIGPLYPRGALLLWTAK